MARKKVKAVQNFTKVHKMPTTFILGPPGPKQFGRGRGWQKRKGSREQG